MPSTETKQKQQQNGTKGATGATGEFRSLGKDVTEFQGFDTFPTPHNVETVTMTSDEVTALCPITGQPDWYTVTISYDPKRAEEGGRCLESKSLKLYLQSYRNAGLFCEAFAGKIADDVFATLGPLSVVVTVDQKPRGGIGIVAKARRTAQ